MNKVNRYTLYAISIALLAAVALPIVVKLLFSMSSDYPIRLLTLAGVYIILTLGLNIIVGYTGQLSMGHVAFFCIGSYTSAILALRFGVSCWIGILAGMLLAGLFGLLLGLPTLRVKADYLAIVTLAFGELTRLVAVNWIGLTRGPMGLTNIPPIAVFGYPMTGMVSNYYVCLALVLLSIILVTKLSRSPFGRAMVSIREDDIAAEAMGVNVSLVKVLVFALGGMLAGMAGGFFAHFNGYISPDNFTYNESVTVLLMLVLGGIGSIPGSVLGAIFLTLLPEALRSLDQWRMVIYGLLMIIIILFRPQGLMGNSTAKKSLRKILLRKNNKEK